MTHQKVSKAVFIVNPLFKRYSRDPRKVVGGVTSQNDDCPLSSINFIALLSSFLIFNHGQAFTNKDGTSYRDEKARHLVHKHREGAAGVI